MNITQMMFIRKPVLAMSFSVRWPLANTIALGGVPMGSIDAQLAASVIGIPSSTGFMWSASAMPAMTGANTITCATLLITSLKNIEISAIRNMSNSRLVPA